jgi:hypothetical protein
METKMTQPVEKVLVELMRENMSLKAQKIALDGKTSRNSRK